MVSILLGKPTAEPVTVAEAKNTVGTFHSDDDDRIAQLIKAAREWAEHFTGRSFAPARYLAVYDAFDTRMALPIFPVSGINSISYLDGDSVRTSLAAADYTLDADRGVVYATEGWPGGSEVNIEFTVAPIVVHDSAKTAILLKVADLYNNAETNKDAAESMLWPLRLGIGA